MSNKVKKLVLKNTRDFNIKNYSKDDIKQDSIITFTDNSCLGYIYTFGSIDAVYKDSSGRTAGCVKAYGDANAINYSHGRAETYGEGYACVHESGGFAEAFGSGNAYTLRSGNSKTHGDGHAFSFGKIDEMTRRPFARAYGDGWAVVNEGEAVTSGRGSAVVNKKGNAIAHGRNGIAIGYEEGNAEYKGYYDFKFKAQNNNNIFSDDYKGGFAITNGVGTAKSKYGFSGSYGFGDAESLYGDSYAFGTGDATVLKQGTAATYKGGDAIAIDGGRAICLDGGVAYARLGRGTSDKGTVIVLKNNKVRYPAVIEENQ